MKTKLFTLFAVLVASTTLWAQNNVITYTATEKLPEITDGWDSGLHINAFNVAISSHEFSNGVGTITFAGYVTTIGDFAFRGCSGLMSIEIPNSVTWIGNDAFGGCSGLTSVTIPNSVTTIGWYAFSDCSGLTSITIPNSVTTIEVSAFTGCRSLVSITIPNSVTEIKLYAFQGCSGLTSATIGNSVTMIGGGAFSNCSSLTSITIPNSVTTIGGNAFSYCSGLTSVNIPNSVTTIEGGAFGYCNGLTSVTIGNSVTTIGGSAFCDCNNLTSVTIPNSVTTIEWGAFKNCYGLTSVTIPNSVTTIEEEAFGYVNNIVYSGIATGSPWGAKCINGYVDGYLVYNDATKATLCGCSSVATGEITIPNSVTTIGDHAFYWCDSLTSVTIPNSVTGIGEYAFSMCRSLSSVMIGSSVTTIGKSAFFGCNLKNGVYITDLAAWCKISFGSSDSNPLSKARNLYLSNELVTDLVIPNSVTKIGKWAFYYCSALTSITIPNSVTEIGDYAFADCKSLTSVTIPNSVTTIGDDAFRSVINIIYNGTATGSPWGAKCVNGYVDGYLVYSDASKTILCGCFPTATGKITIPNSVTTIGENAFYRCSRLISVTIPNSVTTIGDNAFFDCSGLTSITIGNSVTMIGGGAFSNCSSLTSITCYALTPPECAYDVFSNIKWDANVYVIASALTDYQNAEVWKYMQLFPIAAEVTPMDNENPIVTPTDQDVTITWPITDGTDTYTLTITKNGETVCVLTFNANGQLTNIAFAAPGHNGAHQAPTATLTAQGYQFTVTGLNPGTAYDYSVTATDAAGQTLAEHRGNFSTTGGTGLNTLPFEGKDRIGSKYFHNGNLIIERNGIKYTATGQKVR